MIQNSTRYFEAAVLWENPPQWKGKSKSCFVYLTHCLCLQLEAMDSLKSDKDDAFFFWVLDTMMQLKTQTDC